MRVQAIEKSGSEQACSVIERHPTSSSVGATVLFVSLLGKVGTIVSIMGMVGKRVVGEVVGEVVAAVSSTGSERVEGIG